MFPVNGARPDARGDCVGFEGGWGTGDGDDAAAGGWELCLNTAE